MVKNHSWNRYKKIITDFLDWEDYKTQMPPAPLLSDFTGASDLVTDGTGSDFSDTPSGDLSEMCIRDRNKIANNQVISVDGDPIDFADIPMLNGIPLLFLSLIHISFLPTESGSVNLVQKHQIWTVR